MNIELNELIDKIFTNKSNILMPPLSEISPILIKNKYFNSYCDEFRNMFEEFYINYQSSPDMINQLTICSLVIFVFKGYSLSQEINSIKQLKEIIK